MTKLSDQWCTPDDLFNVLDRGGEYQGIYFDGFNFDIDLCATKENSKCDWYGRNYLESIYFNKTTLQYTSYMDIKGKVCFMNPPYSNPRPFIEKAWEDSKHCKIVCLVKVDPSTKWWSTFWLYGVNRYVYFDTKCCEIVKSFIRLDENDGYNYVKTDKYSGPKDGCEVIFFPKRIKFTPPRELIESGEVWRIGNKWVKQCHYCPDDGTIGFSHGGGEVIEHLCGCHYDENTGHRWINPLSGPTFPSCLVIMDRRNR